jgi:hypothetical protein
MVLYYLNLKIFTRGKGSSVTQAAAYRAGDRIRDDRSTRVHDYSKRTDVVHSEILLPSEDAGRVDGSFRRSKRAGTVRNGEGSGHQPARRSGFEWRAVAGLRSNLPDCLTRIPSNRSCLVVARRSTLCCSAEPLLDNWWLHVIAPC